MTTEAAKIIAIYGGEILENYSGRNMFGERTTGVIFEDQSEFNLAIADLLERCDRDECEVVANAIRYLKTDNMGKQTIYY